jgi:hypothetical protein
MKLKRIINEIEDTEMENQVKTLKSLGFKMEKTRNYIEAILVKNTKIGIMKVAVTAQWYIPIGNAMINNQGSFYLGDNEFGYERQIGKDIEDFNTFVRVVKSL